MAGVYRSLQITDATFLRIRGVPSFGEFLEKSAAALRHFMSPAEQRDCYRALRPDLDVMGQSCIDVLLEMLDVAQEA